MVVLHWGQSFHSPSGSQSDVYVGAANGTWTRITTVEDAIAADWLDEDELLVQTTGGVVSAVRAIGTNQFRPLTGLQASSPVIGSDGRVHFLAGRVTQFAGATETFVFAAAANVWSMTADGTDVRREVTPPDQDSLRLDGTWPGGYLYHRGTAPAQLVIGSIPILLPSNAGLIERIAVAPDKRYAIGFAGTTIVRVDITPAGLAPSAVLLLGSIDGGDIWFPRVAPLARAAPTPRADAPAVRYAFALGGNIWTMGADGVASVLRTGASNAQTQRRFIIPLPQWSPAGDRILTVESLGTGASALQLIPVTIDRGGKVTRLSALSSVLPAVAWSPDGSLVAAVALPASPQDPSILLSELNVRVVSLDGVLGQSIPGREVTWTKPGMFVLSNGTIRANDRARDEQAIELWAGTQKRTVTTVARIIGDARAQAPSVTKGITSVSNITAAADGTFVAARSSSSCAPPTARRRSTSSATASPTRRGRPRVRSSVTRTRWVVRGSWARPRNRSRSRPSAIRRAAASSPRSTVASRAGHLTARGSTSRRPAGCTRASSPGAPSCASAASACR